jgi:hypothetical protein
MTFVSQSAMNSEATGYGSKPKNPPWLRTLSHPGAAICVTASTVLARSFTIRRSRTPCAEDRWKKFLSLISRAGSAS